MPKRLTDTDKWKKPFIRQLPVEYKLLWMYLLDDCDHAGIWQVDFEVAEIRLGTKLSSQKAQGFFKEKIVVLDNGTKWFVPDFISFQYGEFNEANKMFKAIIPILKKHSLIPHISPIYGVKVTVKEKDKDKSELIKEIARKAFDDTAWIESHEMGQGLTRDDLKKWMAQYNGSLMGDESEITESRYKRMFGGWLNTQKGKGYKLPEKQKQSSAPLQTLNK